MIGRSGTPRQTQTHQAARIPTQHGHHDQVILARLHPRQCIYHEHTLVLHPTMVEFMRIHGFGSRFIAEGIMFGDPERFAAMNMKINMSGQMSNMNYVGPSLTCPDNVMKEFKIGKT